MTKHVKEVATLNVKRKKIKRTKMLLAQQSNTSHYRYALRISFQKLSLAYPSLRYNSKNQIKANCLSHYSSKHGERLKHEKKLKQKHA